MTSIERRKALNEFINAQKKISEKAGKEVIIGRLKDFKMTGRENYLLTGILGVDLNTNGFKRGTFNVIYGAESGGKSTVTLEICAGIQSLNKDCQILYVDSEQTVDQAFISRIPNLIQDNIIFLKEPIMERAFMTIEELCSQGLIDIVVIDSIDTMVSLAETEKTLEDNLMMDKARVLSRGLARLNGHMANFGITAILIQQERVGMTGMFQVKTHDRSGGKAMRFYPSTVTRISKKASENESEKDEFEGDKVVSQYINIINEKSKISEPFKQTWTYLNIDRNQKTGVLKIKELIDYATIYGLIETSGSWFQLITEDGEIIKVQGAKGLFKRLQEKIDTYSSLKLNLYAKALPPELFIVQFENIKKMLEIENKNMKDNKIRLATALGKENLITENDRENFEFNKNFTAETLLGEEKYKLGLFNIENTYKYEDEEDIEEIEEENKPKKKNKTKEKAEEIVDDPFGEN